MRQVRSFSAEFDPGNVLNVSITQPWHGFICRVAERAGGEQMSISWGWHWRGGISLNPSSACSAAGNVHLAHPTIDFVSPDPSTTLVLEATEADLQPIPSIGRTWDLTRGASLLVGGPAGANPSYSDVYIMTAFRGVCTLSQSAQLARVRGISNCPSYRWRPSRPVDGPSTAKSCIASHGRGLAS